ncbi:MAG: CYTH domain-containing protein [Bacteroidota bacterium]
MAIFHSMEHVEIERKFLVNSEAFKTDFESKRRITQGFLNTDPERTVRVRIMDEKAFLTIKGASSEDGLYRFEWETEIPKRDAEKLLPLCGSEFIDKYRYWVRHGKHVFEVDEFLGKNQGLVIAELELMRVDEYFDTPSWLGEEVTGQVKYYNAMLVKHPFINW